MAKIYINKQIQKKIDAANAGARVRLFNLQEVASYVTAAITARKAAAMYGDVNVDAPVVWDSTAGIPVFCTGRHGGGMAIQPAGAWCRVEKIKGRWCVVDGGRYK